MKEIDGLELNYLALLVCIVSPTYVTVDAAISAVERGRPLWRQGKTFSIDQIKYFKSFGMSLVESDL